MAPKIRPPTTFSKKHYEATSTFLRESVPEKDRRIIAFYLRQMFERDSANFDESRFYKESGLLE